MRTQYILHCLLFTLCLSLTSVNGASKDRESSGNAFLEFAQTWATSVEANTLPSLEYLSSSTVGKSLISSFKYVKNALHKLISMEPSVINDIPAAESELGTLEPRMESFAVEFVNDSPLRTSIYWDNNEEWTRVVDVIAPGSKASINTYPGHVFVFTREGTRDQLGERILVSHSKKSYVLTREEAEKVRDGSCMDRYSRKCPAFQKAGECQKNPGWMIVNCPKSCDSCDLLDPKKRCDPSFLNVSANHVWQPGDLNRMFERIVEEHTEEFDVNVVMRPPSGPWVLEFNNFLSDKEVETLLLWGRKLGFQRSTDTGKENERGEVTKIFSTGRTSTNAWCTGGCESDPLVKDVSNRIVNLTGVPYNNYEQFQLLRYVDGQKYNTHHDLGPSPNEKAGGFRILTFFLYLSDVEEGGETSFPKLNFKVKPKKGKAILWPNVIDEDPFKRDDRTFHAALPVIKGEKFAANHWIHSHDFKVANLWGCTGAFD